MLRARGEHAVGLLLDLEEAVLRTAAGAEAFVAMADEVLALRPPDAPLTSAPGRRTLACCHMEKFRATVPHMPIGLSSVRTPKLSVTTRESTLLIDPTGRVSGTTNQSLP